MLPAVTPRPAPPPTKTWPALAAWSVGWSLLFALDGRIDLANQALVLVAAAAVAAVWLPAWVNALGAVAAVVAFNWCFVPPRYSLSIDLGQHALLLATLIVVAWTVSALVAAQRRLADTAARDAHHEARLRAWGDTLRDAPEPARLAGALQQALAEASGGPVAVQLAATAAADADAGPDAGTADATQRAGLALCMQEARAMGPGTGRHEEQPDLYLPLRARGPAQGAAVLQGFGRRPVPPGAVPHGQALCDQLGQALQRAAAEGEARTLRDTARDQATRNALLAAIAHDHRTPLATILGAASALAEQDARLEPAQRRRLAQGIADEARRLARVTDNTLQLARLDTPGLALRCDWESAEELVGATLARAQRRAESQRLQARVEPGLPLLWCDATLLSQLLDNLVDNALKYGGDAAPVEILACREGPSLLVAVRDRGPGVQAAWRERIFQAFQRGDPDTLADRPGAGLGLAVCRAIARAHGGTLRLRERRCGGSAFECRLPVAPQPQLPA